MNNEEIVRNLSYLIGTRYVPSVKAYVAELTGRSRVVGGNDIITKELDPQRVHVNADEQGVIIGFAFA